MTEVSKSVCLSGALTLNGDHCLAMRNPIDGNDYNLSLVVSVRLFGKNE